ncbi:MAG: VOC family protein [Propionibacteriaceae bacterium]
MHLDHLSFAAGHEGLRGTAERLGELLGAEFTDGGFHPRFGTRNQILPLSNGHYLEVVEVLDHPAADKAPFGQAVRSRTEAGGGWLGWVVSVDDLAPIEERIGRTAVDGSRHQPDGNLLEWRQIGVKGMQGDPQLPFFVSWITPPELHPSVGGGAVELLSIEIAGNKQRLDQWLGGQSDQVLPDVEIEWTAPNGQPGLEAVLFSTPQGKVRI